MDCSVVMWQFVSSLFSLDRFYHTHMVYQTVLIYGNGKSRHATLVCPSHKCPLSDTSLLSPSLSSFSLTGHQSRHQLPHQSGCRHPQPPSPSMHGRNRQTTQRPRPSRHPHLFRSCRRRLPTPRPRRPSHGGLQKTSSCCSGPSPPHEVL